MRVTRSRPLVASSWGTGSSKRCTTATMFAAAGLRVRSARAIGEGRGADGLAVALGALEELEALGAVRALGVPGPPGEALAAIAAPVPGGAAPGSGAAAIPSGAAGPAP